jgi:hypothetical protein
MKFHESCADTDVGAAVDSIGSEEKAGFEPRSPSSRPSIHTLTRSRFAGTTLSHPMGEGQERESFAVPLKIRAAGLAGWSVEETENVRWLFPLLGGEGQGEGELKN